MLFFDTFEESVNLREIIDSILEAILRTSTSPDNCHVADLSARQLSEHYWALACVGYLSYPKKIDKSMIRSEK